MPTSERTLHVHCASRALTRRPLRPIFDAERVTVQPVLWGFACYQFAMLGVVEATIESDEEKNRICPPIEYWDKDQDYLIAFAAGLKGERVRATHPVLANWMKTTRLDPVNGLSSQDPSAF